MYKLKEDYLRPNNNGVMKKRLHALYRAMVMLLLLAQSSVAMAQSAGELSGMVVDIDGNPMVGTSVIVKDSTKGTIVATDGTYTLSGLQKGDIVLYEYLGYQTVELEYTSQTTHNVVMRSSGQVLEDVVVVGYGVQKKETVTGALSQLAPEKLESRPSVTLSNVLGGSMPGIISRQSTGEPGNDYATIYIRGMATWGDKAPLIMVDGVERDLNLINPQEIESFTILKDASATAVYGVRGANGVILINTKKGSMGKPKVTIRSEYATLEGLRFPQYINAYEFASLMCEAVAHTKGAEASMPWTPEELQKFQDGSDPYLYPNVNWIDEVLNRTAWQTINNVNISGGNEIIRYFLNVGYTSQSGLFKEDPSYKYRTNTRSDRYNFRSNTDVNITKDLVFNLSLGGIFQDKTYPGTASDIIFATMRQNSPISSPVRNPDGTPGSGASAIVLNPWALTTQSGYAKQFISTIQSTANLRWDLSNLVTEGLSLSSKFSYDMMFANYSNRYISYGMKRYMGKDENGEDLYNVIREQGSMAYGFSNSANRSYYFDVAVNWARTFNDDHNLSSMLLFNRRDYKNLTAGSSLLNLPYRQQGLAGRLTYDYAHRYMAEFNFGYNGSENFKKGNRYGLFPSVSLGWVISDEDIWQKVFGDAIYLKIRGSYGVVGNDQIGGDRFLYISTVTYGNGAIFGTTQQNYGGIFEGKLAADVTWEKAYKTDIGFDLRLFDEALSLQFDFFNEDRKDILLTRGTIPIVTGITAATYANLGEVNNKGFDAMLEFKKTFNNGLFFSAYANYTYAHNVIIEDDSPQAKWAYQNTRGTSIGQPLGYVAIGFFEDEDDIRNSPTQKLSKTVYPGDVKYKDKNRDGVIDAYDREYIGYGRMPEVMFGFGLSLSYGQWDCSLGFTGATNANMFLTSEDMWPYSLEYPRYNISREYYDNRWIPGADNSNAKYPAVIDGNNPNNYVISTLYMRDASYLKLKNAEIGYRLAERTSRKLGIAGARVFINGINLLCFDHLGFVDPEVDSGTGNYPQQRTINLGCQIDF